MKKKYYLKTAFAAANDLIEKYCGQIPGFYLAVSARMKNENKKLETLYVIRYEREKTNFGTDDFYFFSLEYDIETTLKIFECDLRKTFLPDVDNVSDIAL